MSKILTTNHTGQETSIGKTLEGWLLHQGINGTGHQRTLPHKTKNRNGLVLC